MTIQKDILLMNISPRYASLVYVVALILVLDGRSPFYSNYLFTRHNTQMKKIYWRIGMVTNINRKLYLMAISTVLSASSYAYAGDDYVTLIEMGDLHGTLVPHAAIMKRPDGSEYESASAGGLARLKTIVDDIRSDNPEAVLLSTGDLTHGSAEAMFTVGDAMMIPMNAFGIDVYTPGNWDFGYGAAVFRNRFTTFGPKPTIPGNIRTMSGYIGCDDVPVIAGLTDAASGYICSENLATAPFPTPPGLGVIKANFPTVAANLYNAAPLPAPVSYTHLTLPTS